MDMELWPAAKQSLWAVLEACPHKAEEFAEVLENGGMDGQEEDAVLRYFDDPNLEEDIHIVASGLSNSLVNIAPIEAFVIPITPADTLESSPELKAIYDTLQEFSRAQERAFRNMIDGETT